MSSPLISMIDRMVEEKTFNLDALTAIQNLKERAQEQAEALDKALKDVSFKQGIIDRLNQQQSQKDEEIAKWRKREADLIAREAKVTELEKDRAVSSAVSSTYDRIFDRMFANRVVREMFTESVSKPMVVNGYPQQHTETRTETTEKRDEK